MGQPSVQRSGISGPTESCVKCVSEPDEEPHEKIEVVAALRQDHRPGAGRVGPVPAHVAVREMPVDEVLSPIHRDDVAEPAGGDDLADPEKERRVAKYVRDLQEAAV